jgi:hypothetical protein
MILAAVLASVPLIVGTPAVDTAVVDHNLSVGVTLHLDRRFVSSAEQHRYAIVAAPALHRGQRLPDELFGGTTLGRLHGAVYRAEAAQLRRRANVDHGARWKVALARGGRVVGTVKTIRLR